MTGYEEEEKIRKYEEDFRRSVEEAGYYAGELERVTLDGEWTEEELKGDLYDEANKILNGDGSIKGYASKVAGKALKDKNLILIDYLVEHMLNSLDLIEIYNLEFDKHRNDAEVLFGIHYFDAKIKELINKELKNNEA